MKNKKLNYILLMFFTVLVLFITLKDDFDNVYSSITNLNKFWLIISVFLMFGYWFLKALIIKIYVNSYKRDYPYKKALNLQFKTLFFNGITPFSSGGQPFQVLSLKKDGVKVSDGANVIFITSFIHQFAMFIIAVFAIITNFFMQYYAVNSHIKYLSIVGFFVNVIFMILLLFLMFDKKFKKTTVKIIIKLLCLFRIIKNKDEAKRKWDEKMDMLDEGAKIIKKRKKSFALATFYNTFALMLYYLTPLTIAYAFGVDSFNVITVIVTSTYVDLIGMFIPIPGGTGGLEYAFVSLFSNFVTTNVAKSMMLVWRFVTYYFGMIFGGIILNVDKREK